MERRVAAIVIAAFGFMALGENPAAANSYTTTGGNPYASSTGTTSTYGGSSAYTQPTTNTQGRASAYDSSPYNSGLQNPIAPNNIAPTTTTPTDGSQKPPLTDYQRIMNSVNNSTAGAYSPPQPGSNTQSNVGSGNTPNPNTPVATPATNQPGLSNSNSGSNTTGSTQQSTNGASQAYNATPAGRGTNGYANFNNSVGATTTTGAPGLGTYNASPYNVAPASNPNGVKSGYPATPYYNGTSVGSQATGSNGQ
jgi:hypothetical protein